MALATMMLIICIVIITCSHIAHLCPSVLLKAHDSRPRYIRWNRVPITLHCPLPDTESHVWVSSLPFYINSRRCMTNKSMLTVDDFPESSNITFVPPETLRTGGSERVPVCVFRRNGEFVSAIISDAESGDHQVNLRHATPNVSQHMCFQHEGVKLSSCESILDPATGTSVNIQTELYQGLLMHVVILGNCQVNKKTEVSFVPKPRTLDVNECMEAAERGTKLCVSTDCIDLPIGYLCENGDYDSKTACKTIDDWACPYGLTQDVIPEAHCELDACIKAANEGIDLCRDGLADCVPEGNSFTCKSRTPLSVQCTENADRLKITCPVVIDASNTEASVSTFSDVGKSLLLSNRTQFNLQINNLLDRNFEQELDSHPQERKDEIAEKLMDIFSTYLDTTKSTGGVNSSENENKSLKLEIKNGLNVMQVTGKTLRRSKKVLAKLKTDQSGTRNVKIKLLSKEYDTASLTNAQGLNVQVKTDFNENKSGENADAIVTILPVPKQPVPNTDKTVLRTAERSAQVASEAQSDIVLIDTRASSATFTVKLPESAITEKELVCAKLLAARQGDSDWRMNDCTTNKVETGYECVCKTYEPNTFAIGMIFWIGDARVVGTIPAYVNIVDYCCAAITIFAYFLLILFIFIVGAFRLEQFNIILCLLLHTAVSLGLRYVKPNQHVPCIAMSVTVCLLPLCAFTWKFIFGVNTLLVVVRTSFSRRQSKKLQMVPLILAAYIVPAIIIGAWFGASGNISSGGLCIGPSDYRMVLIVPITLIVVFNLFVLGFIGCVLVRSYILTRSSRVSQPTPLLVLLQITLTLGIPYVVVYLQFVSAEVLLVAVPISSAITALLMLIIVALLDKDNRTRVLSIFQDWTSRGSKVASPGFKFDSNNIRKQQAKNGNPEEKQAKIAFTSSGSDPVTLTTPVTASHTTNEVCTLFVPTAMTGQTPFKETSFNLSRNIGYSTSSAYQALTDEESENEGPCLN